MDTQAPCAAWWQLFLLLPLMIGAVVVETKAPLSGSIHTVATVGLLALTYALVGLWVHANRLALTRANHLVTLLRRSHVTVVRGGQGEECLPAYPLQARPLQSPQGYDRVAEGDQNPPLAPVPTPAETSQV
jgi:hypothetical protein